MSGCALTVAAVWRAIGIDHPILAPPYRDQTAVNRLYEVARVSGLSFPVFYPSAAASRITTLALLSSSPMAWCFAPCARCM